MKGKLGNLYSNAEENYVYTRNLSNYAELNQDLYLWIIEENKLKEWYYDENGNYVSYATKLLVEGKKLDRAQLPPLNLILQSFNIGHWKNSNDNSTTNVTSIKFNFPTATENRKFDLKIGKITNNEILNKIKNNDYNGIIDLVSYSKNNSSIYSKTLTTNSIAYFRTDDTLFDGKSLLEDKEYYYIYVKFDDENGKYYPIEGVTLGQARLNSDTNFWDLWAYTSSNFDWGDLSGTYTATEHPVENQVIENKVENQVIENKVENKVEDKTIAPVILPRTGTNVIILGIMIIVITIIGIVFYKKYNNYKGID